MDRPISLLLTSPTPALLAEISRQRPDWQVITLDDSPPAGPLTGQVWAFVDWLCPGISGLELCRRLRDASETRQAHVTMVIDSQDSDARRRAMEAGADDYLVGPLDCPRLIDRIEAGLPQSAVPAAAERRQQFSHGEVQIDLAAHQVRFRGKVVSLRPNEFRLFVLFLQSPDRVHSRASLIGRLGKEDQHIDERTVDVWVGRLRRALIAQGAPDPLRTVRSVGYVLDTQP